MQYVSRRLRPHHINKIGQRDASQKKPTQNFIRPILVFNRKCTDAISLVSEGVDLGSCYNSPLLALDRTRHDLVDLTRPETRIKEFIRKCLNSHLSTL